MCYFWDYFITSQVFVLTDADVVSVSGNPLISGWLLLPLCTINDHCYAVLPFHCFKCPPWPVKDQQVSVSAGTCTETVVGKCGNTDSSHGSAEVPLEPCHHGPIRNTHACLVEFHNFKTPENQHFPWFGRSKIQNIIVFGIITAGKCQILLKHVRVKPQYRSWRFCAAAHSHEASLHFRCEAELMPANVLWPEHSDPHMADQE